MSTKFKVGDLVQFHPDSIKDWKKQDNTWWVDFGFKLIDQFVVIQVSTYSVRCHLLNFPERICGLSDFKWQLVAEREPYYNIIQKIKYLNNRFKERKHATV